MKENTVSCYNAPYGTVWCLNLYDKYDMIYLLLAHRNRHGYKTRMCLDLMSGTLAAAGGFVENSRFDDDAIRIA